MAYSTTGVGNYLRHFIEALLLVDRKNEYILFFSSMRRQVPIVFHYPNVMVKAFTMPPTLLDILWNRLHVFPIEWFIGNIDIFISSDWTEPPVLSAKKATILYDLIVYKYPKETDKKIVAVQKRKLRWVTKESDIVFCISEATKKDTMTILGIPESRLKVLYPGI